MSNAARAPARYELRILGHLDQHWSTWFGRLTLTHEDDGTTALRGLVTDQAELHGLLAKVRDLGAVLISVTPEGAVPDPTHDNESHARSPERRPSRPQGGMP